MALSGTLDTLSVPELCQLLSSTGKTGALHIRGESRQGVLWFAAGKVCAGEAGGQTGPPPGTGEGAGLDRLHDVCFELSRDTSGSFEFEPDRRPSWPAEPAVEVGGLLAETERRMTEWREIVAVIPSIEARPRLVPEPPAGGPITLDATQWRVVTGIDGRRRVSALVRVLDGGEYSVCRTLRSLVQAGLVEIEAADPPAAVAPDRAGAETEPVEAAAPGRSGRAQAGADADPTPAPNPSPDPVSTDADPLADGLDRGAVVALLASARSK